jgi:exosortase A-associated hydrolase 1
VIQERALVFRCAADRIIGVLHPGLPGAKTAIVIVVGGPQYRVGSHRQFAAMARQLATAGVPVLRFDWRGMGDSEGLPRTFDTVDEDIRAAIDCLTGRLPGISNVVLLGLCDGASANLIYAHKDERVSALILMNPWVRTAKEEAKSYMRHYYLQRLLHKAFWRKLISGRLSISQSSRKFLTMRRSARRAMDRKAIGTPDRPDYFINRMLSGLVSFKGPVLLLSSGRDLTAQEFVRLCQDNYRWRSVFKRSAITMNKLPDADHTFSKRDHLREAGDHCLQWLRANFQTDLYEFELPSMGS